MKQKCHGVAKRVIEEICHTVDLNKTSDVRVSFRFPGEATVPSSGGSLPCPHRGSYILYNADHCYCR
jgi:hypothetical protein